MDDKEKALELKIYALHAAGLAPSQIDARLGLKQGTAHDVMVSHWRLDKTARMRVADDSYL